MGNCCGSESQEVEGHQLQSTPTSNMKKSSNSGGQTLGASSCPSDRNTGGEGSREAILSAAEKRKMQAENRGVKEGGKLSKQLAEQKKQDRVPLPRNEENDKLVWD